MESEELNMSYPSVEIPSDAMIARNNSFVTLLLDDELACIDEATGCSFGLNSTGKLIWELLESPLTLQEIIEFMLSEFPENISSISLEITAFVVNLAALNIVVISEPKKMVLSQKLS